MSIERNSKMTAEEVARFLTSNPQFFEHYPEVVERIKLPHPHGEHAISLSERQMLALREKNQMLDNQLQQLLGYGSSNDEVSARMHNLALALIAADNFQQALTEIHTHLAEHFAIPQVAIRLWEKPANSADLPEFTAVSPAYKSFADSLQRPYCGSTHGLDVTAWFGDSAQDIQSQALIAIKYSGESKGMIALGSEDPQRFYEDMGTLFLERLGELVSAVFLRLAQSAP